MWAQKLAVCFCVWFLTYRYVVARVLLAMSNILCFAKLVLGFVSGFQCILSNLSAVMPLLGCCYASAKVFRVFFHALIHLRKLMLCVIFSVCLRSC